MHPGRFSATIAHVAIESCVHFAAYAGSGRSEINHIPDAKPAGWIGIFFPAIKNKFNILNKNNKDKIVLLQIEWQLTIHTLNQWITSTVLQRNV